ncbi:hypothetical protein B0H19DRAFT_1244608 [Mycena capillaripes]|nr:hypothetical protein B0H19DRAFT_1244608 [Mycena capillaripes]
MSMNQELEVLQDTTNILEEILGHESTLATTALSIEPLIQGLRAQQASIEKMATQTDAVAAPSNGPSPHKLLYGMPLAGVDAIEPPAAEFIWEDCKYASTAGDNLLQLVQEPPPCPKAPDGYTYPEAHPFFLQTNRAYKRGVAYCNDFRVVDKALIRRRLLCTINPPDIDPTFDDDGNFIEEQQPLPGMIRMALGVPYIQRVNGNPDHTVTVAVAHTSQSLDCFGETLAGRVRMLEQRLYILAFGSNPNCSEGESIVGLYKLGLKRNDRSAKAKPGSTDGSFSLASTVEKGQGQGCFQPAVQTATPLAQTLISEALVIIHELQQLILPCCLSNFEWEMYKWWAKDNNVFVFGGLGPGATGLQMNHSSGMGGLDTAIGSLQGNWHADISDAPPLWTLGILMLKLPPGSDPGPFMLARCGLYIRETGVLIIYLLFRGNDLHSGFHPSYLEDKRDAWIAKEAVEAVYNMADPQDRCFFVPYPTQVAYSRAAELAVSPPLTFGNLGSPVYHKLHAKNFSQDGRTVLGSHHTRFTRLSCEIIWGLELNMDTAELFRKLEYLDENGQRCMIEPPDNHDIQKDAGYILKMRGYLAWHFALSEKYLIRITKDGYQTAHQQVFSLVERRMIHSMQSLQVDGDPEYQIVAVIGRELSEGKVVWSLRVENQDEVLVVPEEKSEWLYHPKNRELMADFIRRNIPLNSAPLRQLYERVLAAVDAPAILSAPTSLVPYPLPDLNDNGLPNPSSPQSDPPFLSDPDSPIASGPGKLPSKPFAGLLGGLVIDFDGNASNMEDIIWQEQQDVGPPRSSPTLAAADRLGNAMDIEDQVGRISDRDDEDFSRNLPSPSGLGHLETPEPADLLPIDENGQRDVTPAGLEPVDAAGCEKGSECEEQSNSDQTDLVFVRSPSVSDLGQNEYEVEAIIDYDDDEGTQRWLVRWKGFGSESDTWQKAEDFSHPNTSFDLYNSLHSIAVANPELMDLQDGGSNTLTAGEGDSADEDASGSGADSSGSEFGPKPKRRRRKKPKKSQPKSDTQEEESEPPSLEHVPVKELFQPCVDLLSSSNLRSELHTLQGAFAAANPSHVFKIFNPATTLTQLSQINETNNVIVSYLQFDDSVSDFSASVRLAQLQQVVGLAEPLCTTFHQTDILKRAVQWELCQTLLIVYDWLKETAPKLVSALLLAHQRGGTTLTDHFPFFGRITEHVVLYVREIQQNHLTSKVSQKPPAKKAKTRITVAPSTSPDSATISPVPPLESVEDPAVAAMEGETSLSGVSIWPPVKLREIPAHLHGLRMVSAKAKPVLMPEFTGRIFSGDKFVKEASAQVLLQLLCRKLAVLPMASVDALWNSARRRTDKDWTSVQARLISRGAVLKALVHSCGHEGILVSQALIPLLTSPTALFPRNLSSDKRFMKFGIDDEYGTMKPLLAQELGAFVHHRTLELQQRHLITTEQLLNPHVLLLEQRPLLPMRQIGRAANMKNIPIIDLSPSQLIPGFSSHAPLLFAIPALILREALNKKWGLEAGNKSLRWILEGLHPNTGTKSRANLDHVNPARAASINLELLKKHIPGSLATSKAGLSNLLAWMMTGQGTTKAVVAAYRTDHPRAQLHAMKNLEGYAVLDDPNVWGQAANELGLTPTIRFTGGVCVTITAKLTPYFLLVLQTRWSAWLGNLAGKNPEEYDGSRRTWREAVEMIKSLGIAGVKGNGLTTLQLANNLVFLKICTAPSAADIGAWIAENPGLVSSTRDRDFLKFDEFGAIIVEHLLCKVQRWQERYNSAMPQSIAKLVEELALEAAPWILGTNEKDYKAFPFPLGTTEERVKKIIEDIMVYPLKNIGSRLDNKVDADAKRMCCTLVQNMRKDQD